MKKDEQRALLMDFAQWCRERDIQFHHRDDSAHDTAAVDAFLSLLKAWQPTTIASIERAPTGK